MNTLKKTSGKVKDTYNDSDYIIVYYSREALS